MDVFVSVGVAATPAHEEFIAAIESRLKAAELAPKTVGRNAFSSDAPLKHVIDLMNECHGAVVIALERSSFPMGVEKRAGKETPLENVKLPTIWNQTEAVMAYTRGLPLLVIAQKGLKSEGLLESKYDWNVQWVEPTEASLATPAFLGIFESWKKKVVAYRPPARSAEPRTVKDLWDLFLGLAPSHAWSIAGAFVVIVSGAFALGAKLFP